MDSFPPVQLHQRFKRAPDFYRIRVVAMVGTPE